MNHLRLYWRELWLALCVSLFLLLAGYQLGLPGLHYDEGKEAGVNAMELLTGAPVTAFRGSAIDVGGISFPLMVQDYIGALNVYLALPFLATTGIGVPNLRFLSIFLAVLALLCLERAVSEWVFLRKGPSSATTRWQRHTPISLAGLLTVTLLVAAPSFVFWNRQGIFVTNATLPAAYFALWQGLRWVRTRRDGALLAAAFSAGLALYAKLLAIWIIGPALLLLVGWWFWRLLRPASLGERLSMPPLSVLLQAAALGMVPLLPWLIFNIQTGGTFQSIGDNLRQSYYGVDNTDLLNNLLIRLEQLAESLRGGHFWYLGGIHGNPLAPWFWTLLVATSLFLPRTRRFTALPLIFLSLALLASLFTVSDLFITHYALVHPIAVALAGIALASWFLGSGRWTTDGGRWTAGGQRQNTRYLILNMHHRLRITHYALLIILSLWFLLDLSATFRYHQELTRSGGLAAHSDASYHLAYHLRYNGLGAPIALDWGFDAPVRYLSQGSVRPIEIFGYDSLAEPDGDFQQRLVPFLENPDNVYLLHAPGEAIFQGRRQVLFEQAHLQNKELVLERSFTQKDGTPLFEVWRVVGE
jgi:hypothetical protein